MEDEEKRLHMAIIVGAAKAASYLKKNWKASEEEAVQYVTDNVKEILEKIDDPL